MKPRNREINIFNLSMLDVISGAMAAFLMIMIVLLPFYKKEHIDYQAQIAALQRTLAEAQAAAEAARQAAATARAESERSQQAAAAAEARATQAEAQVAEVTRQLHEAQAASQGAVERLRRAEAAAQEQHDRAEGMARQLAKTFLVVFVRWGTTDDVDLHVIDPSGAEFYWDKKRTIPGRPGELSEDTTIGPGAEVWEIRDAPPGTYKVLVELFSIKDQRKPVVIQGRFIHRDGSEAFSQVSLSTAHEKKPVATIVIDAAGHATTR